MNFNKFLKSLFGDKSTRDMKLIQPLVETVKSVYPSIKALSNDELRAKTKEIQAYVQDSAKEEREKIDQLRATIEDTPIDEREKIFNEIDDIEKVALDKYEKALNEVMPVAFSIIKDTARRFSENEETVVTANDFDRELAANPANDFITIDGDKAIYHNEWTAGGNKVKWDMVHYDVQLFGGIALHQGKIAEMATGEGKTLVATLPVFLNALTGNGVHMVTVNDYLAKRDSEWMGPLYMFNGLSVDCIDKLRPNSEERRRAYQADITFGTNNEFGFDYLRDNMAISPADLVQRKHNFAIVDEVDSVLIDDARTPLIISGPIPKGDDQMFEEYQPLIERLYEVQRKQATELLAEARQKITAAQKETNPKEAQKLNDEGFLSLFRSYKALPKNKALIKFLSEEGIKSGLQKTEEIYMENNNRRMPEAVAPLYFVVDEKLNSADLTDKGGAWLAKQVKDDTLFVLPDIASELSALESETGLTDQERVDKKDDLLAHYGVQSERVHTLQQLLKAYTMFNKDDEYVVMDGEVKIVDEQTGRIMEPLERRSASGHRSQGACARGGSHTDLCHHHAAKLFPHVPQAGRYDGYRLYRGRRVLGHLQAGCGGDSHQQAHRPQRYGRPCVQDQPREVSCRNRRDRGDAQRWPSLSGWYDIGGNLRVAEQDAQHAQDTPPGAQRQAAPEGGTDCGTRRTEYSGHRMGDRRRQDLRRQGHCLTLQRRRHTQGRRIAQACQ